MRIFNIFRRKEFKPQPKQLRIDGTKTTLTPTPDDAELAATALLEHMCDVRGKREDTEGKHQPSAISHQTSNTHDVAYYRQLADRIKESHEQERRAAMRYVAYVEGKIEELKNSKIEKDGSAVANSTLNTLHSTLSDLERGLYQHQDCAEREGGELLRRWQKCLAECILKQYNPKTNTDLTDGADEHQPSDI